MYYILEFKNNSNMINKYYIYLVEFELTIYYHLLIIIYSINNNYLLDELGFF